MRHIIIIGILVLFSALVTECKNISQEEFDTSLWENNIYNRLGVAPLGGSFAQEDYWVWGSSVIRGDDGKYHMFVSR